MRPFRIALIAWALLTACSNRGDTSALLARVTLPDEIEATCLDFQVWDERGTLLLSQQVPRAPSAQEVRIGLYRAQLPPQVRLSTRPLWSNGTGGCDNPLPNGPGITRLATFPSAGVTEVDLPLEPLTAEQDRDGDHFAGVQAGGPDCTDDAVDIHPGAPEQCQAYVDFNCNGKAGCADPVCDGRACATLPTQLAFVTAALRLSVGECSSALTLETRDGNNQPRAVTAPATLLLSAAPPTGTTFFAEASCLTPLTQLRVPAGESRSNVYLKATQAGSLTVSAEGAGLGTATQTETLIAGPPTALLMGGNPQTLTAGEPCSQPIALQALDLFANPSAPSAPLPITLSASPAASVTFYTGANCSGAATPTLSLAAGARDVTFSFRATRAGLVRLTASAPGYTSGTQGATVLPAAPAALAITSAPQTALAAGKCSSIVTLEARDAYGNRISNPTVSVVFSAAPNTGFTFYSDATCTTPTTGVDLLAGAGSVYFAGQSGGNVVLTAAAKSLTEVTQTETLVGMMRSGTCVLNTNTVNCPISPALTDPARAFIVFQATLSDIGADATNVMCWISSASEVTCSRNTNTSAVNIAWSIPQFVNPGVNVQHYQVNCVNNTVTVPLNRTVNPANTFLLLSSQRKAGNQSGTSTRSVVLTSATTATINNSGPCSGGDVNDLQVVEVPGITVTRGTALAVTGLSHAVSGLSAAPPGLSFLLYSYRTNATTNTVCDQALRGELSSPTSLAFTRGDNSSSTCDGVKLDEISWERVQLPQGSSVQSLTLAMPAGTSSATQPLAPVDLTRVLAFAGGQWASGQVQGEGSLDKQSNMGDTRARFQLTAPNTLTATRDSNLGTARFTAFAVEWLP